jgi:biotin carboxylase
VTASQSLLLVMGSGDRNFREYLLASAARRYPLWLFDPDPATWQRPYLAGSTVLDVFDPGTAVAAARELARRHRVLGVYCYHEAVILAAAHVAADLGLPGPTVDAVAAVRDKARSRELLTRAGLGQPRYALVTTVEQAQEAARSLGFPLVCKPRGLGASQGVVKVEAPADLPSALTIARSAAQRGMANGSRVLLEEYLPGPEISLDAAVIDGEYLPFIVARKKVGDEPFFEEIGHFVTAGDPLLCDDELAHLLADAHAAVGWRTGITHTEVKMTTRGLVTVEINGRLGGDLIPYLGWLATGIDPGEVAVDIALGNPPKLDPTRHEAAGIHFLYPPVDCRVRKVGLPRPSDVPGLHQATVVAGPGTVLRLPPGGYVSRYGLLIARGPDVSSCAASLASAADRATLSYDPPPVGS